MKTIFYYLMLFMPLGFALASCDDDENDVPDIGIQATISGGVFEDDEIFVTKGDELVIDGLTLINRTDKEGALGAVSYYWDHYLIGTNLTQPFELRIDTSDQPVGRHLLQAQMPIYVVDYPICWGYIQYYVNIVEAQEELPDGGDTTARVVSGMIKEKE